jgi:hypothetical protein
VRRDAAGGVEIGVAAYERDELARAARREATPSRRRRAASASKKRGSRARATRRKVVILFVAANPRATDRLGLAEECAQILRELRMTIHRDDFVFEARWAVSVDDFMRALVELDPTVIHVSGHGGGSAGLILQDERGEPQPVSARALAMMIEAAARSVRVVVLNACYSTVQAEALRSKVDCVVGMAGSIGDDAARAFAVRLYGALGGRRSIGNAFAQAVAALAAKRLPDEALPRCLTRHGVDARDVVPGVAPEPA